MSRFTAQEQEIVELTRKVLEATKNGDFAEYTKLNDETLTAFEPEAGACLAQGLAFHKFYFDVGSKVPSNNIASQNNIMNPHVRMLGENAAVIAYVRGVQVTTKEGAHSSVFMEETRVWQKFDDGWKQVHFHRSKI